MKICIFVIQVPASTEEWSKVAEDFQVKWNYPRCIGAMDDCGSEFFKYKQLFCARLVALVDAN